jgi:hypothetical protein
VAIDPGVIRMIRSASASGGNGTYGSAVETAHRSASGGAAASVPSASDRSCARGDIPYFTVSVPTIPASRWPGTEQKNV